MNSEFGLSSEWPIRPMPELVYFQEGPGLRNWQYRDTGIPFVNIRCIKDGRLLRAEMTCLDPAEVDEKYKHFLLDEGDYVVSSSGTLGRLAEVTKQDLPCMLNTSVIRFRPKPDVPLDRRYLRYFLTSDCFSQQVLAFANGSAQLNYGPSHLKQMGIAVPPLNDQVAIGRLLGAIDDRITLLRETNATLEAIAQALFKSWFVDFDPVRAKMAGRAPEGMDEATAALFPDSFEDSALGEVPRGWRVGALQDLLVLQRGFDLPAQDRMPGPYPIIAASGPSGTHTEAMAKAPGVVTGRSGVLGRVFLALEDYWPLNTTLWVKDFKAATPCYAYELLRMLDFKAFNAGSAVPTLNRNHVHGLPYVIPDRTCIEAYEAMALQLHKRTQLNSQQADSLCTLRDTLLPRLISGQLRLPEALAITDEALA